MTTESNDALAPTPQDFGLPSNPTIQQQDCWYRQGLFLEAYAKCGKIGVAAKAIGVTRWCVERWQTQDLYGFNKRLAAAHKDYVEFLEVDFDDWVAESKHNTQIARIFRLRAEAPEKYREEVKVVGIDASKQMLDRLRELAARERKEQAALESGEGVAIEGVYREVSSPGHGQVVSSTSTAEERTPESPEPMPNEPTPPAKRPARGKRSAPPPQPGALRQVNRR
jgi:hypothetical protein